jgi:F0F1-type ATP synthase delta subunit
MVVKIVIKKFRAKNPSGVREKYIQAVITKPDPQKMSTILASFNHKLSSHRATIIARITTAAVLKMDKNALIETLLAKNLAIDD